MSGAFFRTKTAGQILPVLEGVYPRLVWGQILSETTSAAVLVPRIQLILRDMDRRVREKGAAVPKQSAHVIGMDVGDEDVGDLLRAYARLKEFSAKRTA